ncbi:MAG: hypothetical protein K5873_12190 [Treponema sp.]|nr:hypothetical protein [Treponema sp.]
MDNANQVDSNLTHKEVALFLGEELKSQNTDQVVTYNLEDEYAKTAKNKKKFVWALLAACFFIVGLSTSITVKLLSNSNHRIEIKINSFNDLNLRSLLGSVGRVQNAYERALKNKENLELNYKDELAAALQKKEMDLFTLESVASVATKKSIEERKSHIEEEYKLSAEKLKKDYQEKLAKIQEEIKNYEEAVNSYDSKKLSEAKNAEATIDSTKQLHDIEMNQERESYEKKIRELRKQLHDQQIQAAEDQRNAVEEVRSIYQAKIDLLDPRAREESSDQDKIILHAGIKNQTASKALWQSVDALNFSAKSYESGISSSSENLSKSLKKTEENLKELKTIACRFKPIPMENSIKDYVPAIMHQSYQLANELASSASKLQEDNNVFESLIEKELSGQADGLVVSTKTSPELRVYILSASKNKIPGEGIPVQIFNDSKGLAEGSLVKKGLDYIVTLNPQKEEEKDKNLPLYRPQNGDKIRIVLSQNR